MNRVAWGLVGALAVVLTVGAGVCLHYLRPIGIQMGNTALSYRPIWRVGYQEFRSPRSGMVFARVLTLGPLTVAFWPPAPSGPPPSTR